MATLAVQTIDRAGDGLLPVLVAADVAGDDFVNTGLEYVEIVNGDASPHTATFTTPRTVDGLAVAELAVVVPATETRKIGPFPTGTFNDGTKKVAWTYDAVTTVTVGVFKLGS